MLASGNPCLQWTLCFDERLSPSCRSSGGSRYRGSPGSCLPLLWPPQTAGCAASHPTLLRLLVLTSCLKWLLQSHTRLISEDTVLILILVFYFSLIVMGDVNNVIYPSWDTNNRPKKLSSLLRWTKEFIGAIGRGSHQHSWLLFPASLELPNQLGAVLLQSLPGNCVRMSNLGEGSCTSLVAF